MGQCVSEDSRTTKDKIKSFKSSLDSEYTLGRGYELLEDKKLSDKDKEKIIGIMAAIKGSCTILDKMLEKYRPEKASEKEISKLEKAFIDGIGDQKDVEA